MIQNSKEKMNVLVTVPHAVCVSKVYRDCDRLAEQAGRQLATHLRAQLLVGDVYRANVDLNRYGARSIGFRVKVRKALADTHVNLLLDVHSFPNSETWRLYERPDIVVLDNVPMSKHWLKFVQALAKSTDLNVAHLPGGENDIVEEARAMGVRAILIEFREGLSAEQLERATKSISDYFKSSNNTVVPPRSS
jgi:hypothetical protein